MIDVTEIATRLRSGHHTLAVAESSTGGLVSAALLAVPGASAYFLGAAVVYTGLARTALLGIEASFMAGMRPATEPYAALLARTVRERFGAGWGLGESGAAGPAGNRYGDPAGHTSLAVAGPGGLVLTRTIATGHDRRGENMEAFAAALLTLLDTALRQG